MATFDEQGNEITEPQNPGPGAGATGQLPPEQPPVPDPNYQAPDPNTVDPNAQQDPESPDSSATEGKYQIGDKYFDTLEEAHAYATSQLGPNDQIADAYRQGIQDAINNPNAPQSVTPQPGQQSNQQLPQEDDFDEEEYFSNPKEFLQKYASKIKQETLQEIQKTNSVKEQSDQIWREFTDRHPALADFRQEAEAYVNNNAQTVQQIIANKGKKVGYDYIATQLREQFKRYSKAVQPTRKLPNSGGGASPSSSGKSVTPPKPKNNAKKPVDFADQLRSIRKRG